MTEASLYGGIVNRRITVRDLQAAKERGERWAMLTSYDMLTASLFDEAGIPALLVGDSAGNNVLGYDTTVPVTVEDMIPLVRGVVRGTRLWRLRFSGTTTSSATAMFQGSFGRLRTVMQNPRDGSVWLTTSNRDGRGSPSSTDDRVIRFSRFP